MGVSCLSLCFFLSSVSPTSGYLNLFIFSLDNLKVEREPILPMFCGREFQAFNRADVSVRWIAEKDLRVWEGDKEHLGYEGSWRWGRILKPKWHLTWNQSSFCRAWVTWSVGRGLVTIRAAELWTHWSLWRHLRGRPIEKNCISQYRI